MLGFSLNDNSVLTPPEVDERKPEGLVNRARLLRCWLELGMWIAFNRLKCSTFIYLFLSLRAGMHLLTRSFAEEAASVPVLRLAVHSSRDSILKTLGGGSRASRVSLSRFAVLSCSCFQSQGSRTSSHGPTLTATTSTRRRTSTTSSASRLYSPTTSSSPCTTTSQNTFRLNDPPVRLTLLLRAPFLQS